MAALPELSEDEHQALDLLESLEGLGPAFEDLEGAWADPDGLQATESGRRLLAVLDQEGIGLDELRDAHARVRGLLERFVPAVARTILSAAGPVLDAQRQRLSRKGHAQAAAARLLLPGRDGADGELMWMNAIRILPALALLQDDAAASDLDGEALSDHLRQGVESLSEARRAALDEIDADSSRAWTFTPAPLATQQILAIPRDSLVQWMLRPAAAAEADRQRSRLTRVVTRWTRAAYLRTAAPSMPTDDPTAPELARFRLDAVRGAGNEIRARALAGDEPDQISLAREVVKQAADAPVAMRAFTRAVESARAEQLDASGPKRRFTWLHLTLAVVLVAVTAWHYWLR